MAKAKVKMSIVTVVSFDGSSNDGYKIAMRRTDGCMVTLTELAAISKAGMKHIPAQFLSEMLKINGYLETDLTKENGNEL